MKNVLKPAQKRKFGTYPYADPEGVRRAGGPDPPEKLQKYRIS